jgi:membrane-bound serine protease (ClpP class)
MSAYVVIALIALGLVLAEAVLPTGGVLGAIGVVGFFAAGIVALAAGGSEATAVGIALVVVAVASWIVLWAIARKVYAAHRDSPVRGGPEEMIGTTAEVRTAVEEASGQVFTRGGIWSARLAPGSDPVSAGGSVVIEAVDGLTLVVRPAPQPVQSGGSAA